MCVCIVFVREFGEKTFQIQNFELNCNAAGPEAPLVTVSLGEQRFFPVSFLCRVKPLM